MAETLSLHNNFSAYLSAFFGNAEVGLSELSSDGRFLRVNDTLCRILQRSREELLLLHFSDVTAPGDLPPSQQAVRHVLETGEPVSFHKRFVLPSGQHVWVNSTLSRLSPSPDQSPTLLAVTANVSERERVEQALRGSEEKYRSLFDSMDEGFCIIQVLFDTNGAAHDYRFLEANPAFTKQTGLGEAVGKTIRELAPNLENHWFAIYGQVALTGVPIRFQNPAAELNRIFDAYAFRVGMPGEHRVAVLFKDITERKRREENLAFVADINDALVQLTGNEEAIRDLAAKIGAFLRLSHCAFARVSEDESHVVITHDWHRENLSSLVGSYQLNDFLSEEFWQVSRAGKPFIVRDTAADTRVESARFEQLGIGAFLTLPLVRDGKWRFLIAAYHATPYDWRDDEIELLGDITTRIWSRLERVRAEDALRTSEARMRIALDAAQLATWEWDIPSDRVYWNDRHFELFGMPPCPEPVTSETFAGHIHPDDRDGVMTRLREAVSHHCIFSAEFRAVRDDGAVRWMSGYGRVTTEANGQATRMNGVMFDITERKQAEEQLRRVARRDAFMVALSDTLRGLADPVLIKATAARLLGEQLQADRVYYSEMESGDDYFDIPVNSYTRGSLPSMAGRYPVAGYNPWFFQELRAGRSIVVDDVATWDKASDAGRATYSALQIRAYISYPVVKEGRLVGALATAQSTARFWTEAEIELVRETAERTWASVERARAEDALRQSQERLQLAAQVSGFGIHDYDLVNDHLYWSPELKAIHGLAPDADIGFEALPAYIHPDDSPRVQQAMRQALDPNGTGIYEQEFRIRRADNGEIRFLYNKARTVFVGEGNQRHAVRNTGIVLDVSERKRAKETLRESEERFRLMVDGARDYAMFLLDAAGSITFWSQGAERIFDWPDADVVGRDTAFMFSPEDLANGLPQQELQQALWNDRVLDRSWKLRRDGTRFWSDGVLTRLDNTDGSLRGFAKVVRDATDQKQTDDTLQAALETMAGANEELEQQVQEQMRTLADRTHQLATMSRMRQELLRQLVSAQEQERARISRDLHDDTGQQLTALLLGLGNLKNLPGLADDHDARKLIDHLSHLAGEVAQKSHRISFNLRPTDLDDLGLVDALQNYVEQWQQWSRLPCELERTGLEGMRLPPEVETTIYRVVQEALTNILRYATGAHGTSAATRVSILLQKRDNTVHTLVEDNGPGFDVAATLNQPPGKRRLGIFGMQERARLAGGSLSIESAPGEGTTVFLRLPLPSA